MRYQAALRSDESEIVSVLRLPRQIQITQIDPDPVFPIPCRRYPWRATWQKRPRGTQPAARAPIPVT
ncbi:hypothetical protein PUN4_430039 [Paraburkholderia unamae]|nr:hypothetical protein PUN4_430039 [Paraburkholderia unamae]